MTSTPAVTTTRSNPLLIRLTGKLAARDLTRAVYSGLLERDPDKDGVDAYRPLFERGGQLADVIKCVASSTEFRERFMHQCAGELTRAVYSGLLERDPDEDGADACLSLLEHGGHLADVIKYIASSTEFRERFMRQCAGELTRAVYSGLLERDPDEDGVDAYLTLFEHGGHLTDLIKSVASSTEFRERFIGQCAGELLRAVFQGILHRDPTPEELTGAMTSTADLTELLRTLGTSEEHWQAQFERHAERLEEYVSALFRRQAASVVNDIYSALLGRFADPQGSVVYTDKLQSPSDIGSVVKIVADSEEHWQLQLNQRAPALIDRVACALHSGYLDHVGLAPHDADAFTMALTERIRSITESDRYFSVLVSRRSEALLDAVYRALLNRPVDREGLAAYGQAMRGPNDLGRVIHEISTSPEYKQRLKASNFLNAAVPTPAAVAINHVEELFQKLAGRAASPFEVSRCLAHGEQLGRATPTVLREFALQRDARDVKVLLFGAYGNGNMGDAYQAIALQKHLMETWGLRESQIFATSLACSSDFPFPPAQKLPPDAILDPWIVNRFDCLIIGGGGLIGHPHEPLFDAAWVGRVHTPMLLLAVGAASPTAEMHRALLERAWLVSGRDEPSLAALKRVREDAVLIRDPILSIGDIAALGALDAVRPSRTASKSDIGGEVLWILKYPASRKDIGFLTKVANLIQSQDTGRHSVVSIEPERDQALEQFLPGQVRYLSSLSDLRLSLERAKVVVSMRYHGCIFAALAGKPSIGYSQPKIKNLYAEVSIPGFYEAAFDHLEELILAPEMIASRNCRLDTLQSAFSSQLKMVGTLALIDNSHAGSPRPD